MSPTKASRVILLSITLLVLLVSVWIASCTTAAPTPAIVAGTPTFVEAPRIVERVVTATPETPPAVCARGDLAAASEVVIGALAPLSSPGAIRTGLAMQTAFNLAVDDLNNGGGIGGRPVRLVTYDTANSAELGARYAEQLIEQDCAALLVGVHHAQVAQAVKAVVERLGVPIIFSAVYGDDLTADLAPAVFRLNPNYTMLAQMPGQWLTAVGDYNHDGTRFVVQVTDHTNDTAGYAVRTSEWLTKSGFSVRTLQVDLPTNDFSPVIARIVALEKAPDAILLLLPGDTAFSAQQQLLAAGVGPDHATLIVSNMLAVTEPTFWQLVPDGVYTVVPHFGAWPSTVTPLGAEFARRHQAFFDHWPEGESFAAYDAVRLAGDAIQRANSLAPSALITALEQSDVTLASGHYRFPYGAGHPPDGVEEPLNWWHQWLDVQLLYLQFDKPNQPPAEAPVIWPPLYQTVEGPVLSRPAH